MRKGFLLAAAAALGLVPGCSGLNTLFGPASLGWRFEVGTPSTLTVPSSAIVSQGPTATAATPLAAAITTSGAVFSGPAAGPVFAAQASPCVPTTAALAAAPPCDLSAVCRKLDDILRRLPEPIVAPRLAMPAGTPNKGE